LRVQNAFQLLNLLEAVDLLEDAFSREDEVIVRSPLARTSIDAWFFPKMQPDDLHHLVDAGDPRNDRIGRAASAAARPQLEQDEPMRRGRDLDGSRSERNSEGAYRRLDALFELPPPIRTERRGVENVLVYAIWQRRFDLITDREHMHLLAAADKHFGA